MVPAGGILFLLALALVIFSFLFCQSHFGIVNFLIIIYFALCTKNWLAHYNIIYLFLDALTLNIHLTSSVVYISFDFAQ